MLLFYLYWFISYISNFVERIETERSEQIGAALVALLLGWIKDWIKCYTIKVCSDWLPKWARWAQWGQYQAIMTDREIKETFFSCGTDAISFPGSSPILLGPIREWSWMRVLIQAQCQWNRRFQIDQLKISTKMMMMMMMIIYYYNYYFFITRVFLSLWPALILTTYTASFF